MNESPQQASRVRMPGIPWLLRSVLTECNQSACFVVQGFLSQLQWCSSCQGEQVQDARQQKQKQKQPAAAASGTVTVGSLMFGSEYSFLVQHSVCLPRGMC